MDHLLSMEKVTFPKLVNVIVQINKLRSSKKYLKKWCEEIEVVRRSLNLFSFEGLGESLITHKNCSLKTG